MNRRRRFDEKPNKIRTGLYEQHFVLGLVGSEEAVGVSRMRLWLDICVGVELVA